MTRRLIPLLAAGLFAAAPAAAQEAMEWTGSASAGIRYVDDDAKDRSKLNEYRDLGHGAEGIFGLELRGRSDDNYFNGYGENLGRDDQFIDLNGGRYNTYRYRVYSDQLRHNFGSGAGALSPYSGIGTNTITTTFPNTNVANWNTFDHSYTRRDTGVMLEWQKASPWYARVDANEVRRQGVNVFAGAQGTSPGNGFVDLPSPIEYKTRNYAFEVGHATRASHFAVNLGYSTFENENDVLRWTNGFFGNGLDTTILPIDNQQMRLGVNGSLRQLPMESTLGARFTWSRQSSDVGMPTTMLSTGGANPATNPSHAIFNGEIDRMTLGLALNSRPAEALDTKVYANWIKEENNSTDISFSPAAGSGLTGGSSDPRSNCNSTATNPCRPELFEYEKRQLGVEAGYRLGRENRLSGGYEWTGIDRERADFQETTEQRVFAQWKNSSFDWLTARFKYQFMARRSKFQPHEDVLAANPMDLYVRRFDAANVNQNLFKLGLDATFAPFDLGFEAIFKDNDYKDTPLGRTGDKRQEYYASVGWGNPRELRVLVFGDVEFVDFDSAHRVGTGNPDPATPPTGTTYNWTAKNQDNSWQVGVGVDWAVITRLKLKASYIYAETDGSTDFSVQPGGAPGPFRSIQTVDDTRRTSFTLRAVYDYDRHWEFTTGYSYERYHYDDIGYDDTRYVVPPLTTSASYTTGQFAFQDYKAHIFFAVARYRF
jgi:MtrB/PioB family decaheme-associated outer membrane protein